MGRSIDNKGSQNLASDLRVACLPPRHRGRALVRARSRRARMPPHPTSPAGLTSRRVAEVSAERAIPATPHPHRYFGDNVYNASGARQTVIRGGRGERHPVLDPDGERRRLGRHVLREGLQGNTGFVLRAVLVGAFTQSTNAENVTPP